LQIDSGAVVNLTGAFAPTNINRTFAGLTGAGVLYGAGGTVTVNKTSGTDSFGGDIQGGQGLIKDGAGTLILAGNSSYSGATAVNLGGLLVNGINSGVGLVSVAGGARIGGDGSLAGGLGLGVQAQFIFNPLATLDVVGAVTLDNLFSVESLVKSDGSAIDWGSIADGTYTLINTTSTFNNISNFGAGNAADIGGGRTAYFQNGSLQLVVVPEPSTFVMLGCIAACGGLLLRRRRASVAGQR
jgi:autotransporter-associated beta strand protein